MFNNFVGRLGDAYFHIDVKLFRFFGDENYTTILNDAYTKIGVEWVMCISLIF